MEPSVSSDNLLRNIAPKDKFRLVCIGFTILGVTTLLPMNFSITATHYWMYKFRNVTTGYSDPLTADRTPLQTFFESYLSIANNLPMLLSVVMNALYGHKFNPRGRLYLSLGVMLTTSIITTFFTRINTDGYQTIFFVITMMIVTVNSLTSAFFQATVFGILSSFPSHCMHAMINGQAIAGLLAVALLMLTMINETDPLMNGLWYFSVSTICLGTAIISCWLMDNDYMRYYLKRVVNTDDLSNSLSVNIIESKPEIFKTIKRRWQVFAAIVVTFWTTLAVFPGICVLIVPQYPNTSFFTGRFFSPIVTFLIFNVGDLAGRMCSLFTPLPSDKKNTLLALAFARSILPLAILFCNVTPRNNTSTLFVKDIYYPILNGFSAFTNGYIFSSAMVIAPVGQDPEHLEITGFIMAFALAIGLSLGSVTSSLLIYLI